MAIIDITGIMIPCNVRIVDNGNGKILHNGCSQNIPKTPWANCEVEAISVLNTGVNSNTTIFYLSHETVEQVNMKAGI